MSSNEPEKGIVKQIKCPSVAKTKYNLFGGVDAVVNEFLPETVGYLFGYLGSGKGDFNRKSDWGNAGIGNCCNKKKHRVLGSNYFVNKGTVCGVNSSGPCKNQDEYMYIRTYPLSDSGAIGSLVEDLVDLNPVSVINSVTSPSNIGQGAMGTTCTEVELPIGNSLNDNELQFKNENDYIEKSADCLKKCDEKKTSFENDSEMDNCKKKCKMGWWVDKKCMASYSGIKHTYGNKEYLIPSGLSLTSSDKNGGNNVSKFVDYRGELETETRDKEVSISILQDIVFVLMVAGVGCYTIKKWLESGL